MAMFWANESVGNFVHNGIFDFGFVITGSVDIAQADCLGAMFAATSAAFGAIKLEYPVA
jgi:hypothetical protein